MIRTICRSRTYQLSSETNRWNEDDELNFSHAIPRRLPAEVLYDALHAVVGAPWRLASVAPGTRAAQLPDVQIKVPGLFLDQFGRPPRESPCECDRSDDLLLGPIMALVNGPAVADAIVDPANELAKLEAEIKDDRALVDELFLRVLNRPPTAAEIEAALEILGAPIDVQTYARERADRRKARVDATLPEWLAEQHIVDWEVAEPRDLSTTTGTHLGIEPDSSILATGPTANGKYVVVLETRLPQITGLQIEVLADERLPKNGPGRASDGNFVLSELRVTAAPLDDPLATQSVGLRNARADYSQDSYHITAAIDDNLETGWAIADKQGTNHVAKFELRGEVGYPSGTRLFVELEQHHEGGQFMIGRFRLSLTGSPPPYEINREKLPVDVTAILRLAPDARSERQRIVLRDYYRSVDPDLAALERAVDLVGNPRLVGLQDLAWALINTPAFLFNH